MKTAKLFMFMMITVFMTIFTMASDSVATRSPGVPAAMLMMNGSEITVMGFNLSSEIPKEDIDDLYKLASGMLGELGGGDSVSTYSPADLEGLGITTGDSLHSMLKSGLAQFKRYLQIDVFNITSPVAGYRIEIYMWDNDQNSSGTFMAGIEIPLKLPLIQLLGMMETGTHNLKIDTTANETTKVSRMSFYYQDSPGAQEVYMASVEITALLMQTVLMSFMQ
ncbi:MAG: hypothetical protein HQK61_07985 [Desulfamplus sp.]|nr:hypothetical protein [Desulfamplus sp.]